MYRPELRCKMQKDTTVTNTQTHSEETRRLLQLEAKRRQDLIMSSEDRVAITRTLSGETLLYTIKEIGMTDAADLLALASRDQVRHIFDLDCWRKDHFDDKRLLDWLSTLQEGGEGKLTEWLLDVDIEILVLLIQRHVEVIRRADIEDDVNFNHSKYFTFDDQYLLRFYGDPIPILRSLVEHLRNVDYRMYLHMLENSLFELASGLEEEALRWRTARIADRGYPGYSEAREFFSYVPPGSVLPKLYRRENETEDDVEAGDLARPDHALVLIANPSSSFLNAMVSCSRSVRAIIGQELAYLTNLVVTAEARDTGDVEEIRRCVEMAHDNVNIGLLYSAANEESDLVRLLESNRLSLFFRYGLSLVQRLQHRGDLVSQRLEAQGFSEWGSYLDSPYIEMFRGLKMRYPAYFVGLDRPGEISFRNFAEISEVETVEYLLRCIPAWFDFFRFHRIMPVPPVQKGVTLSVLWNTAFARYVLGGERSVLPLSSEELREFRLLMSNTSWEMRWLSYKHESLSEMRQSTDIEEAMDPLFSHARQKLEDILVVEADSVDLRFIEGLLVRD